MPKLPKITSNDLILFNEARKRLIDKAICLDGITKLDIDATMWTFFGRNKGQSDYFSERFTEDYKNHLTILLEKYETE